jgi:hypothetical protein
VIPEWKRVERAHFLNNRGYICHDCRVYLQDPKNPLSKPAKCRYDPYQVRWE